MRKTLVVVLCGMLLIFLTGCGSSGSGSSGSTNTGTETVSASISASGGSITTPSGNASLNVPSGALSSDQSITVSPSKKVTPPGNVAGPYDYTPDGQTFTSPVTISLKYDPDLIPVGMSTSDLRLAWLAEGGAWEIISGSTVDTTNHLVSGQTSHFSTYTVVVHERKPFGEQTGEFNSVIAYSNGTTEYVSNEYNSYDGYNTGIKWLCDEYVNRYYKQVYDKEIRIEGRSAKDYYQNAAARGLTAYPNDGSEQPQAGDILVSEYGDYGHVAIVREVQDNKIYVIQQNWSDNGADDRYPITREGNHVYPFDGKKGNYEIKGWLRANSESSHSISGQVTYEGTGLSGVTITLAGTSSATATTDSSGNYSFSGAANSSYTITASKSGYSFSPASISATVSNANLTGKDFTATANTYTISGKVTGDKVSGVTITLTGTGSTSTTTDSSGNYSFTGAVNGSYTVTPSLTSYTVSPISTAVTVDGADKTGINFTSTASVAPTYTISGTISGDVQGGVIVTLTGAATSSTTTDSSGNYSFSGVIKGSYTITPSKTGYTFNPASKSVTVSSASVTGQNFTATENTYTISGTVSGDIVSGVTITLTGSGSATTTTDGSGNYSFTGAKNGTYTITASKTGYTFSPTSISATVSYANLTGQNVTSTENTYTISGTVSGAVLSGVTITLTGSGSTSATTDSSGNYIFSGVKNGSYTITASKTGYTISPTSISATVSYADLTRQNFTSTENTYTVSGTVSGAVVSGVTITLTGSSSSSTTTDSSGNYSFTSAKNGTYTLTASKTGYTFSPTSISASVSYANLTGQNFTATENTYTVSGTVSGAVASGVTITLTESSSTSTTTDSGGNYSFTGAKNGTYIITASLKGYTFSPASISATVSYANLTGQNFTATILSSAKAIKTYSLNGVAGTINETAKTITVTMPRATDVTNLVATFTTTGQTVRIGTTQQISGTTVNDFTSPVTYTVTAADDSTVNYIVTVNLTKWTKQVGTASDDGGVGVAVDTSGNIYVTGFTKGSLDGNTNAGDSDMFLVKYNSAGIKQWTRQLGTAFLDKGNDIAVDTSGNIYITGVTYGGLDGNTYAGNGDIFLVKYNAAGTKQWTQQFGSTGSEYVFDIAVDNANGYIYVTGRTDGDLDGNTNAGKEDIFIVKYDTAGTKQWTKQLGTSLTDVSNGIAVDASGNVYICGGTYGGLDGNTNANSSYADMFLMKFDAAGTKQWTQQFGTALEDGGYGVAVDSSGNIYVIGTTNGNLDGNTTSGGHDMFLVKYNAAGTKQWTRLLGTSSEEISVDTAVDTGGNVYATGYTYGNLDGNTNAGKADMFIVKYDNAGTKQWTRQLGTSSSDFVFGVAVDSTNGYVYLTGETDGGLDGNTNIGGYDMFLVKYDTNGVLQ